MSLPEIMAVSPRSRGICFPIDIMGSERNQTWGASETSFCLPRQDHDISSNQPFNLWSGRLACASHKPHALARGY